MPATSLLYPQLILRRFKLATISSNNGIQDEHRELYGLLQRENAAYSWQTRVTNLK